MEEQQQEQETQQEVESNLGRLWPDLGQRSTSKSMEKKRLTPVSIPEEYKLMPIPEEKENKLVSLYVHIYLYLIAFLCQGTFFPERVCFKYYIIYLIYLQQEEEKQKEEEEKQQQQPVSFLG